MGKLVFAVQKACFSLQSCGNLEKSNSRHESCFRFVYCAESGACIQVGPCLPTHLSEFVESIVEDPMTDLPASNLPKTNLPQKRRTGQRIRHCRQCFRDDYHKPIKFGLFANVLLMVFTLGLFYFFRPCRCTTCGTKRRW